MIWVGWEPTEREAQDHFGNLQGLLSTLGLEEAKHKASPPSQCMTWLRLQLDTLDIMVPIPPPKLQELERMIAGWILRTRAGIHDLRTLLSITH